MLRSFITDWRRWIGVRGTWQIRAPLYGQLPGKSDAPQKYKMETAAGAVSIFSIVFFVESAVGVSRRIVEGN